MIQLAALHFAQFQRRGYEANVAQAELLLYEAAMFVSVRAHENRAAAFMLQLHAGRRANLVRADGRSVEQAVGSRLTDDNSWALSVQLLNGSVTLRTYN